MHQQYAYVWDMRNKWLKDQGLYLVNVQHPDIQEQDLPRVSISDDDDHDAKSGHTSPAANKKSRR